MIRKSTHIFSLTIILALLLTTVSGCNHIQKRYDYKQISGITKYNSNDISDLVVLCKVWGFLKYYHPTVIAGKYNWDTELIKILPSVLNTKSQDERNDILLEWESSLGKFEQENLLEISPDSVRMYPDLSWIDDSASLGNLSAQLVKIKMAKRPFIKSHYINLVDDIKRPFFENEDTYPKMSFPNASYRLLSLFRYWNIIQYYYPYKYLIGEDWNNVLQEFIPQFIYAKNELEYKLTLLKLITRIHDAHALIYDPIIERYKGNFYIPLKVSFIEGKPIITDYFMDNIEINYPLKIGDVILKINGKEVEKTISERLNYTQGSNLQSQLRNLSNDLLRSSKNNLIVSFLRDNRIYSKKIPCYPFNPRNRRNIFQKNKPLYQLISKSKNIGYLYLGSSLGGNVPDFSYTKGLIIDLRCYPNIQKVKRYAAMQELYKKPVKFVKFTSGSINQPGLFKYSEEYYTDVIAKDDQSIDKRNIKLYKGKVIILVNELTQSHAEFMAMMYRCSPNAVVIGSTTAGADGDISVIPLPGNIKTSMSGVGIYYPDGRETQRIGIVPDIVVSPTIKGIRDNRDEVLEKAIVLIELSNFDKDN